MPTNRPRKSPIGWKRPTNARTPSGCGDGFHEVSLTRAEFIDLKNRLAQLRGYAEQPVTLSAKQWDAIGMASGILESLVSEIDKE